MSREYKNYLVNTETIVFVFSDGMKVVDKTNPYANKVIKELRRGNVDRAIDMIDLSTRLTRHTSGKFYLQDGKIMLDGEVLPEALSNRLLQLVDADLPYEPLIKFWDNLKLNPSDESKKDLYAFLEHNGIPITEDGCFIAYKMVTNEFKDMHSGEFDNSVGAIVRMDRDSVDPDRNRTCSTGLHVAAFRYAQGFGDGVLLEVKVNPMNVVAVPVDYNNEKMRVCEYEVIATTEKELDEVLYGHHVSSSRDEIDDDGDFEYEDDDEELVDDIFVNESDAVELDAVESEAVVSTDNKSDIIVSPDSRGRVGILRDAIADAFPDMATGNVLYAVPDVLDKVVRIYSNSQACENAENDDCRSYVIDKSMNIRLSRVILAEAGIANCQKYLLEIEWDRFGTCIVVSVY